MPLVPTSARLKLFALCGQGHSSRVVTLSYRLTVNSVQTLKVDPHFPKGIGEKGGIAIAQGTVLVLCCLVAPPPVLPGFTPALQWLKA
jgi:hypothetical protein